MLDGLVESFVLYRFSIDEKSFGYVNQVWACESSCFCAGILKNRVEYREYAPFAISSGNVDNRVSSLRIIVLLEQVGYVVESQFYTVSNQAEKVLPGCHLTSMNLSSFPRNGRMAVLSRM